MAAVAEDCVMVVVTRLVSAFVAPVLTYFAVNEGMGFAKPMLYATVVSLIVYVIAVYLGPETKGKQMTAELEIFGKEEYP